jgi:hypothetical protein
MYYINNLYW